MTLNNNNNNNNTDIDKESMKVMMGPGSRLGIEYYHRGIFVFFRVSRSKFSHSLIGESILPSIRNRNSGAREATKATSNNQKSRFRLYQTSG